MENQYDLMESLKWSELSEIENYLDCPMDEWDNYTSKAKLAFALQYMLAKRNNPSLTIESAEEMTIKDLSEIAGMEVALPKEETSA